MLHVVGYILEYGSKISETALSSELILSDCEEKDYILASVAITVVCTMLTVRHLRLSRRCC